MGREGERERVTDGERALMRGGRFDGVQDVDALELVMCVGRPNRNVILMDMFSVSRCVKSSLLAILLWSRITFSHATRTYSG